MVENFSPAKRQKLLDKTKVMSGLNPRESRELSHQEKLKWQKLQEKEETLEETVNKLLERNNQDIKIHRISRKDPYEDIGYNIVAITEVDQIEYEFCLNYQEKTNKLTLTPCQLEKPEIELSNKELSNKRDVINELNNKIQGNIQY